MQVGVILEVDILIPDVVTITGTGGVLVLPGHPIEHPELITLHNCTIGYFLSIAPIDLVPAVESHSHVFFIILY